MINAYREDAEEAVQSMRENIEIRTEEMAFVREVSVLVRPFELRGV